MSRTEEGEVKAEKEKRRAWSRVGSFLDKN